ncbi:MAG TPA: thiamine pyrophosphate-dependent dehydrogenase E1 component subunit alpha [Ktedonobacterales bacterium]
MPLDQQTALSLYRQMVTIRGFEETMVQVYTEGKTPVFDIGSGPVPGEMHLAAGQEPVAVGVCAHLRPTDFVTGPHRAHHFAIAKGVDLKKMAAEIFGKETGLGKGKGGHMHLFDTAVKFSCSGIVGAGMPPAVGAGLAAKMQGRDDVAVAFFGEGAANQGAFHESLNLAAVWKLPVVFVCEDNSWAISVPKTTATAIPSNADRAQAYGIPGVAVHENDVAAVYEVASEAVAHARRGEGPSLLEIHTERYLGHFQGDPEVYRDPQEVPHFKEHDPINRLRDQMKAQGWLTDEQDAEIRRAARATVDEAIAFARESPYPAPEEALEDVFVAVG